MNGVITRWSNQAENIFAWPKSEAVGKPLYELILPANSSKAQIEEIKNSRDFEKYKQVLDKYGLIKK